MIFDDFRSKLEGFLLGLTGESLLPAAEADRFGILELPGWYTLLHVASDRVFGHLS